MNRISALALATCLLAGCTGRDEEAAARLDEQQARIDALQQEVQDAAKAAHAPRGPTDEDRARDQRLARLEARLEELGPRIAKLEGAGRTVEPAPAPAPAADAATAPTQAVGRAVVRYQNKPPQISVYSAGDGRLADFIVTPPGDSPDLFPVRVTTVSGRRTVTGTHPTTRLVETDEIYKDDFGRERKRQEEITSAVNEYAYEVAFSIENLTRTEKVVSITAGEATRMLSLKPGEKRADLVIRSVMGASLRVESGADFKRYGVTYE